MVPKLNIESKLALLEQAIRCPESKIFPKVLVSISLNCPNSLQLLNKNFVISARFGSTYRFILHIEQNDKYNVWFETQCLNSTRQILVSMEQAGRLFQFLKPNFFVAYNYWCEQQKFADFLKGSECEFICKI